MRATVSASGARHHCIMQNASHAEWGLLVAFNCRESSTQGDSSRRRGRGVWAGVGRRGRGARVKT